MKPKAKIETVPALECDECGYQWPANASDDAREASFEIVEYSICNQCRVDHDTN